MGKPGGSLAKKEGNQEEPKPKGGVRKTLKLGEPWFPRFGFGCRGTQAAKGAGEF